MQVLTEKGGSVLLISPTTDDPDAPPSGFLKMYFKSDEGWKVRKFGRSAENFLTSDIPDAGDALIVAQLGAPNGVAALDGAGRVPLAQMPVGVNGTFLALTDTPSSYAGQASRVVRVNATANALEFLDPATDWLGQYFLNAGRAGGQTLIGGTGAADKLTLKATSASGGVQALRIDDTLAGRPQIIIGVGTPEGVSFFPMLEINPGTNQDALFLRTSGGGATLLIEGSDTGKWGFKGAADALYGSRLALSSVALPSNPIMLHGQGIALAMAGGLGEFEVNAGADNANNGVLKIGQGQAGAHYIKASKRGTGTYRDLTLMTSDVERINIKAATEIAVNDIGAAYNFRVKGLTNANLLLIDAPTDRIGIGTAAPTHRLEVRAPATDGEIIAANLSNVSNVSPATKVSLLFTPDFVGGTAKLTAGRLTSITDGGTFELLTTRTPTGAFASTLFVNNSGSVGIGTQSPLANFHVAGSARVDSTLNFGADVSVSRGAADRLDLASGDSINLVSGTLQVANVQVVAARGAAVADAVGGAVIDVEARAALNALLARVRAHGLIA